MQTFNGIGTTLYGKTKCVEFVGAERVAAEQHGFDPKSYQAIKWFVILFMPVVPLGTYRIIKLRDSQRFNMQPVPWDWAQVLRHAGIAYGGLAAVMAALMYLDMLK